MTDNSHYYSFHELVDDLEREWNESPWYKKAYWTVRGKILRFPSAARWRWNLAVNMYQRARYGVGFIDMWSYDEYIAKNIIRTCRWMIENQHVYPGEDRGFTPVEWQGYLSDIADDLDEYLSMYEDDALGRFSLEDYAQMTNVGISAMKRFSEYFNHVVD